MPARSMSSLIDLRRLGGQDSFTRRTLLLSIAGLGFLAAAGIAAVYMALRSADAERAVVHGYEVRQQAYLLLIDLQAALISERGFLLGEDERQLAAFDREAARVRAGIDRLSALTADNPEQQDRLNDLRPEMDVLLDRLRHTLTLMRDGRRDEAVAVVRSDFAIELTNSIRDKLDALAQAEIALLTERQARATTLRHALLGLVAVGLSAAVALALVLARSSLHYIEGLRVRTEQLEAESKLRRETEGTLRQAQRIEAVGQLTGGIAHDFNNLLTIILGNLDTMQRRLSQEAGQLASSLRTPLDHALQGVRSAAQLTHRLLAFSRQQPLEPQRIDCNRVVAGMSDLLRRTLGETIEIETVVAGGLWPTFADASQLENALINLAVNARDAMPNGGRLTIETSNAYLDEDYVAHFGDVAPGQYVLVSVTDTGIGVPADALQRVFEPFFTTKEAGKGSGLGLAMVHGFVKQSGGHVRIYSEEGQGTTVKVYLPRLPQATEVAAAPAAIPPSNTGDIRARPHETVLLVEDNEGVRQYTKTALEDLGYRVLDVGSGKEALQVLDDATHVDLLFSDVVLPGGMNGRELAETVVQQRPGLPVLFTTGYTRNAIIHHGRLDPNVNLLNKPYTQQELGRKLRQLLSNQGTR